MEIKQNSRSGFIVRNQKRFHTPILGIIPGILPKALLGILPGILAALLAVSVFTACGRTPGIAPVVSPGSTAPISNQPVESRTSESQVPESQVSESPPPSSETSEPQATESQETIRQQDGTAANPSEDATSSPAAGPSPTPATLMQRSQPGATLDESIETSLLVRLLMMDDYSLKGFQESFGNNLIQSTDGVYGRYSYPDGLYFDTRIDGSVTEIGLGNGTFTLYPEQVQREKADMFGNPGEEWLILYERDLYYRLLVLDGTTLAVLQEYETGFLNLLDVKIGDFLREGTLQLYLDGYGEGNEKRAIYRVVSEDFVQVFDIDSFSRYKDGVTADITGSLLNLEVKQEGFSTQKQSRLPDRIYYDNRDISDINTLLAVHASWHLLEKEGKWFVTVRNSVDFNMLGYYWGPPVEKAEDNSMMLNDLARVDLVLEMGKGAPVVVDCKTNVKYDNPAFLSVKPIGREEGQLLNGPVLESTMEEAFAAAGGDINTFEYAEQLTVNGVSLFEFTGSIVDITVTGMGHTTTRGMKIGDAIQTVERLYGKPDVGFSGDDVVSYKCTYEYQGKSAVNYFRGMDVSYSNGVVRSFTLYQVILD